MTNETSNDSNKENQPAPSEDAAQLNVSTVENRPTEASSPGKWFLLIFSDYIISQQHLLFATSPISDSILCRICWWSFVIFSFSVVSIFSKTFVVFFACFLCSSIDLCKFCRILSSLFELSICFSILVNSFSIFRVPNFDNFSNWSLVALWRAKIFRKFSLTRSYLGFREIR